LVALGFGRFEIRINNRLVLNGLLEELGLEDRTAPILIALDKLAKQGREGVLRELEASGVPAPAARRVVDLAETRGTNAEVLQRVEREFGRNPRAAEGIARLRELAGVCVAVSL